jgi:hypothetical protein
VTGIKNENTNHFPNYSINDHNPDKDSNKQNSIQHNDSLKSNFEDSVLKTDKRSKVYAIGGKATSVSE